MYCERCGGKNADGARYCVSCGATLPKTSQAASGATQKRNQTIAMVAFITGAIVFIVLICTFSFVILPSLKPAPQPQTQDVAGEPTSTTNEANQGGNLQTYPVYISLQIPAYDEATSTPVPMLVEGHDSEGNAVSQYYAVTSSLDLKLAQGDYTMRVVGSPVSGEGRLYAFSAEPVVVEVNEAGANAGNHIVFNFTLIEPEDVTDEQIQASNDALVSAGIPAENVTAFCEKARSVRQQRQDEMAAQVAAEQEAAKQAERENPASVDGSSNAVTLKGTLVREEWPMSKTMMAWSAVGYFLEFDTPVSVTFDLMGQPQTETVTRIQVASVEQYGDEADKNLSAQSDPNWEQYVGTYVAVSGKLFNQGNAHCLATARFEEPVLEGVL